MQLQVAGDAVDRFENGRWSQPGSWLWLDLLEQALGEQGLKHDSSFCQRGGKALPYLRWSLGWLKRELLVSYADVRLAADTVQKPLPDIPFEVHKKVGNRVLMIAATMPDLLFGKFLQAAIDLLLRKLDADDSCFQK